MRSRRKLNGALCSTCYLFLIRVVIFDSSIISFQNLHTSIQAHQHGEHTTLSNLSPFAAKQQGSTLTTIEDEETNAQNLKSLATSPQKEHYIFGYGSLICPLSRAITAPTIAQAPAHPAVVHHFERTWTARIYHEHKRDELAHESDNTIATGSNTMKVGSTAMGVQRKNGAKCTGVLIRVNEEELAQFDEREIGYDRVLVDVDHIAGVPGLPHPERVLFLGLEEKETDPKNNKMRKNMFIWVYIQRKPIPATKHFPIVQSYVDIILRGCLSISNEFVRSFLETTKGWWHDDYCQEEATGEDGHYMWVNDRHAPQYVRADAEYSRENGGALDEILKKYDNDAFDKRRVFKVLPAIGKDVHEFD